MGQNTEMKYLFISHKNAEPDLGITRRLYDYLTKKKYAVWYDNDLTPGMFHDQIFEKLLGASCYVFIASARSLAPTADEIILELGHMWEEWKKHRKVMIPLIIDDAYFGELKGVTGMLLGANQHQAVIMSRFATEEEAFQKVADYLSAILEVYANNPDDFEFDTAAKVLLHYKGKDPIVKVPDFVEEIAERAFAGNLDLEQVIIPSGVKKIGGRAFYCCENLMIVEGMLGVEDCGDKVFVKTKVPLNEENGYSIGGVVFQGETKNGVLTLPQNARTVADNAFNCRDDITSIELPAGLENIGRCSFWDCFNLKELRLPAGLKRLGGKAFYGCSDLEKVTFEGQPPQGARDAFEITLEEN